MNTHTYKSFAGVRHLVSHMHGSPQGDVTMKDMDILGHLVGSQEDDIPFIDIHPEGATIDLQPTMADPREAAVEAKLQDLALAKSGLSQKALDLITLARKENIDKLKLDGGYKTVNGEIDPSWT